MGAKSKSNVEAMEKEELNVQSTQAVENEFQDEEPKLKGAFVSSLIVGAIIIVMWVAVYALYQAS
ncbi:MULTISPECIES: cytochrome c oxidase subunit 2A [Allobacillus]|uniref:Cytochrome c oxidase subunit 2A n=1 Tax=Allobacillus salarius TaxID=1955272 RepID=A0A556PDM1_9BACI|nr:cytochrome c oxidase subunit 2A [Allobacillus salarius]TSJ62464.1 cytochrome c oxidase subunit 2A [Allobacillus salarius]